MGRRRIAVPNSARPDAAHARPPRRARIGGFRARRRCADDEDDADARRAASRSASASGATRDVRTRPADGDDEGRQHVAARESTTNSTTCVRPTARSDSPLRGTVDLPRGCHSDPRRPPRRVARAHVASTPCQTPTCAPSRRASTTATSRCARASTPPAHSGNASRLDNEPSRASAARDARPRDAARATPPPLRTRARAISIPAARDVDLRPDTPFDIVVAPSPRRPVVVPVSPAPNPSSLLATD